MTSDKAAVNPVKVEREAVQAFKHAYGQNFVDGKLIKVDERIARALEAALLVMLKEPK